VNYKHGMPC